MGEVLSQNEIDSLLKALSSGELDVDEIKDDNEKQVKNCPSREVLKRAFANA